jgi:hypothetical protein
MSWNGLQETLAELFADLFDRTNWKLAIVAWHSLTSDVSQQEMLRSVAKQGPSLVITNVQPFPWSRLIVDGIAETASVGGLIASSATHQLRQLCPPRCAGLPCYIGSLLLAALAARVHTTC